MSGRITWTTGQHSTTGRAAGFPLFHVYWALTGGGWQLTSMLPIKAPALETKYDSISGAQAAAEVLLDRFIRKVDAARAMREAEDRRP